MFNKEDFNKALDSWVAKISPSKDRPQPSIEQQVLIRENLGYCGCIILGSKQTPKTKGKEHLAIFNANLIVEGFGKVWYGDIDVTRDEEKIKKIAHGFKTTVYILREMDGRFEYENKPQIQNAVYKTDGIVGNLGVEAVRYYERVNGKIYLKEIL